MPIFRTKSGGVHVVIVFVSIKVEQSLLFYLQSPDKHYYSLPNSFFRFFHNCHELIMFCHILYNSLHI